MGGIAEGRHGYSRVLTWLPTEWGRMAEYRFYTAVEADSTV
jgi:hypothetical protein